MDTPKSTWKLALAVLAAPLAALALLILSSGLHALFPSLGTIPVEKATAETTLSALLFLLELTFFYFVRAFLWVGEPLAKANLGKITKLQNCFSATQVKSCFEGWGRKMTAYGSEEEVSKIAAERVLFAVREALWRDIWGFIPVYSLTMVFGLWFAAEQLHWDRLQSTGMLETLFQAVRFAIAYWPVLPLVTLVADYIEDTIHLGYARALEKGTEPSLSQVAFVMTGIKLIAFCVGMALTLAAIIHGTHRVVILGTNAGWTGKAALAVFGVGCLAAILAAITWVERRLASIAAKERPRTQRLPSKSF